MRGLGRASWAVVSIVTIAGSVIAAQAPKPMAADSPAALALASAASAPNLFDLVRTALESPLPEMRMTAARISAVAGMAQMVPDLARALSTETHVAAAAAEMQSLLVIGTTNAMAAVQAYAPKASGEAAGVFALWLSRSSPEAFADRLPEFLTQVGSRVPARLTAALEEVLTRRPDLRVRMARAWIAGAPDKWHDLLQHLRPEADAATLAAGLAATDERVREKTIWHLLAHRAWGGTTPAELIAAAMPPAAPSPTAEPTWEGFARAVMARVTGGRPDTDRADWLRTRASSRQQSLREVWWLDDALTRRERNAIQTAMRDDDAPFPGTRPLVAPPPFGDLAAPAVSAMRTAPALYLGFIPAVMAATGCSQTRDHGVAGARLTYRADGRPTSASLDRTASPECQQALRALIQVTLADDIQPMPGPNGEWILLFTGRDYRECVDTPIEGVAREGAEGSVAISVEDVTRPKLVRRVDPVYPAIAKDARIAGRVVVHATLTARGCVRDARVTRSVTSALDLSALTAITQWRYTPTLVQGRPVDIRMSINVTFAMK